MGIFEPMQPPHFLIATQAVPQVIPGGFTLTTVLFDTVNKMTDGAFNPATGHYVPGILGWWDVYATVFLSPADPGVSMRMDISKSDAGLAIKSNYWLAVGGSDLQVSVRGPILITAPTDAIVVRLFSQFAFDSSTDGDVTTGTFFATFIGAA